MSLQRVGYCVCTRNGERLRSATNILEAYKKADGMKIDGRRVVVDYERGRTQKTWLPRRLGGGKGDTRRTRESKAALEAAALEHDEPDREHRSSSAHRSYSHERDSRDRDRDRTSERERNGSSSASRRRSRSREKERDRGRDSKRHDEHRSSREVRNGGDRDRVAGQRDRDYRDDRGYERDRRRY